MASKITTANEILQKITKKISCCTTTENPGIKLKQQRNKNTELYKQAAMNGAPFFRKLYC